MTVNIKSARLSGEVIAPSSKSEAHRLLICAAFADGDTEIELNSISSDIAATAECICALGAEVEKTDFGFCIKPIVKPIKSPTLRCRDSGSTLRFLLPVAAAAGADAEFVMEGRLPERPLYPLDAEMAEHGTALKKEGTRLFCRGKMTGSEYTVAAGISSQFISGILMALPLLGGGKVHLEGNIESLDYIKMTLDAMRTFGVDAVMDGKEITVPDVRYKSPGRASVGGDWSGAAFWVCAGALSEEGITVKGVRHDSVQGDRRITDIVRAFGAECTVGENSVTVKHRKLCGVTVDAAQIPDLVPVISVLSAGAEGQTSIINAARLRIKESDRLAVMNEVLSTFGADVTEGEDSLVICGGAPLHGCTVDSYRDHRIAMSAAVGSMLTDGGVTVTGAECVSKSYADFWSDFASLGGNIEIIN